MITPGSRLQNAIWRPGQILTVLLLLFALITIPVSAITCDDPMPSDPVLLTEFRNDCEAKKAQFSGQAKTLSQALSVLNTQIKITQAKISTTILQLNKLDLEITDLAGRIESIDYSLDDITKQFISRVRETYMRHNTYETSLIAQSSGFSDILRNTLYAKRVRDHDRLILISLEKSRLDFNTQKETKEIKQKEIEALKKKLDADKSALAGQVSAKNQLLIETKNSEAKYQQLRASAQAQLDAFSSFVSNQGGSSILSGSTKTDSGWGTYYNQREDDWGGMIINNQSNCGAKNNEPCSMASIGCLVTSMAMVMSHYGKSVTPGNIASQSELFSFADFRQGNLSIAGVGTNRTVIGYNRGVLDSELASGKPVIVGLYSSSYPHHFIVVKAKDGDDYLINDPFPENGMNIKFTSRYPLSAIKRVDRVTVN